MDDRAVELANLLFLNFLSRFDERFGLLVRRVQLVESFGDFRLVDKVRLPQSERLQDEPMAEQHEEQGQIVRGITFLVLDSDYPGRGERLIWSNFTLVPPQHVELADALEDDDRLGVRNEGDPEVLRWSRECQRAPQGYHEGQG